MRVCVFPSSSSRSTVNDTTSPGKRPPMRATASSDERTGSPSTATMMSPVARSPSAAESSMIELISAPMPSYSTSYPSRVNAT